MEHRHFSVTFQRMKVLICIERVTPHTIVFIGVREGTLYKLQGNPIWAYIHNNDNLCELWHKRLGHLHYKALKIMRGLVIGLPKFNIE